MGEYILLAVEVPATVRTEKMSTRGLDGGTMVVSLYVVCKQYILAELN